MRRSKNFALNPVCLDREIKSTLPDLIVICAPCYVNKRLNTRPALSKRDSVYVFFSTSLPPLFSRVYRLPMNLARNITTPVLHRAARPYPPTHNRHKGRQHDADIN